MVMMCVLAGIANMDLDYVSKMAYNKDKDLVFVYKPYGYYGELETVHEVHHLEQTPPYSVSTWADLNA